MSVVDSVIQVALAAVHEVLDRQLHPEKKAKALDEVAERLKFDARAQEHLDAHHRQVQRTHDGRFTSQKDK